MNDKTGTLLSRRDFLKVSALAAGSLFLKARSATEPGLIDRVLKYGVAGRIPALEFHGDNYYMYNGAYCMNPATFKFLMEWLQKNEVWAVTSDQLAGYLSGELDLPARSIILTTDSGAISRTSLARMVPVLQDTGMHFISLIWTHNMSADESLACTEDACWEAFRQARDSGTFSFGSHSETHRDLALLSKADGFNDLLTSKKKIEDALGVSPRFLSWPFESVPSWAPDLQEIGFMGAFAGGGSRKTMADNVVRPSDPSPWDLPRVLPPNIGTLTSGRPIGKTLPQMLEMFTDGFGDQLQAYQERMGSLDWINRSNSRLLHPPR